jgi:hypothetical protein
MDADPRFIGRPRSYAVQTAFELLRSRAQAQLSGALALRSKYGNHLQPRAS